VITNKLASKAQTTIPRPVRAALKLRGGDVIDYRIEGGKVLLSKAIEEAEDNPFVLFEEWDGGEDRKAYAAL